jgi:SAM-dependent methyltransferase
LKRGEIGQLETRLSFSGDPVGLYSRYILPRIPLPVSRTGLPIPEASIDTIVMTWTLCSIPDPDKALRQMRRVLKPDGQFLFIEHGRSPESGVVAWQDRLTPP